jgi:hypothetical protein
MLLEAPHLWGVSRLPGRRETETASLPMAEGMPVVLDRWEQRGGRGLGWHLK